MTEFSYCRYGLEGKEKKLERILEIVPAGLSWLIIIGMAVLSLTAPIAASVIIIAFVLYWLLRMIYVAALLMLSYVRFAIEKNTDWQSRIEQIDRLVAGNELIAGCDNAQSLGQRISERIHHTNIKRLVRSGRMPPKSPDVYHVVIIPVVKETMEIVEPGITAMENGSSPSQKILVVIALEERASETVRADVYRLQEKHKQRFFDFLVTVHQQDMAGEARVKGANATCAARKAAEYLKAKSIPYENVIVSCFDADTVPVHDYFSCLKYYFMITPQRTRTSYQPVPLYFNNIWDVPCFARIIDIGTSFFQLVEATNPKTLVTFSSHSMSFKALADIGYWPTDIISDDSAIFWKALLHYDGDYKAVPIPVAVSMDIVTGRTVWETFLNIYRQKRRWAWGVENFPIVMRGFLHSKKMPLCKKLSYTFRLVDKFTSWATWPILLAFVSWLPVIFAGKEFATTTVYYITPRIRKTIFALAFSGIIVCMLISLLLLPVPRTKHRLMGRLLHTGEWLFIPVIILVLSALPALDAQTRLMLGRYMEFWVTDKYRLKTTGSN